MEPGRTVPFLAVLAVMAAVGPRPVTRGIVGLKKLEKDLARDQKDLSLGRIVLRLSP